MQDLLSVDREKSREDTLGKTGSLVVSSVAVHRVQASLQEPIPVNQLNLYSTRHIGLTSYSSSMIVVVLLVEKSRW